MSEIPAEISLAEPDARTEPDPRWGVVLTLGKTGLLLMLLILMTIIIIPSPDNVFEISVATVSANKTLVRHLKLPDDATLLSVRRPVEVQLQNILGKAENASMVGLPVEFWESGKNQTIPCTTIWSVYQQEDDEDLAEAPKFFDIVPSQCDGNVTVVTFDDKCEYSVFLITGIDGTSMRTFLWLVYAVLLLLELYIVIVFKPKDDLFIATGVATTGIAILTVLGSRFPEQNMFLWTDLKRVLP